MAMPTIARLTAAFHTLYPIADRATVTWREAAERPPVLRARDLYDRQFIDAVFDRVGAAARPVVETNCPMAMLSHAKCRPRMPR